MKSPIHLLPDRTGATTKGLLNSSSVVQNDYKDNFAGFFILLCLIFSLTVLNW